LRRKRKQCREATPHFIQGKNHSGFSAKKVRTLIENVSSLIIDRYFSKYGVMYILILALLSLLLLRYIFTSILKKVSPLIEQVIAENNQAKKIISLARITD